MHCSPSLARAEKNSSALQGRWLEEPEWFPTHVSFRKGNKTAIMAAARAYTWEVLIHSRIGTFFGLKILILNCSKFANPTRQTLCVPALIFR